MYERSGTVGQPPRPNLIPGDRGAASEHGEDWIGIYIRIEINNSS